MLSSETRHNEQYGTTALKNTTPYPTLVSGMSKDGPKVWPVILSGGSGTRLWPKSRILYPKQVRNAGENEDGTHILTPPHPLLQFHSLTSEKTLLQEALMRVVDTSIYAKPMVNTHTRRTQTNPCSKPTRP
jgi:hypothetical protein